MSSDMDMNKDETLFLDRVASQEPRFLALREIRAHVKEAQTLTSFMTTMDKKVLACFDAEKLTIYQHFDASNINANLPPVPKFSRCDWP